MEGVVLLSKLQISTLLKIKDKSFKYILKRIGPNTDTCATAHNNSLHELNILLTLTLPVLFFN